MAFVPLTSFQFFLSELCVITVGLVSQTHSFCSCFLYHMHYFNRGSEDISYLYYFKIESWSTIIES